MCVRACGGARYAVTVLKTTGDDTPAWSEARRACCLSLRERCVLNTTGHNIIGVNFSALDDDSDGSDDSDDSACVARDDDSDDGAACAHHGKYNELIAKADIQRKDFVMVGAVEWVRPALGS